MSLKMRTPLGSRIRSISSKVKEEGTVVSLPHVRVPVNRREKSERREKESQQ